MEINKKITYFAFGLHVLHRTPSSFPSTGNDFRRNDRKFKFTYLFPLIGAKEFECILKPWTFALWTPHKEHTESAIRNDHLSPCRFKCWTNLYSIGIRQPLAQLQCRYNIEMSRVSLLHARAKWDFRTDRNQGCIWNLAIDDIGFLPDIWSPNDTISGHVSRYRGCLLTRYRDMSDVTRHQVPISGTHPISGQRVTNIVNQIPDIWINTGYNIGCPDISDMISRYRCQYRVPI